MTGLPQLRTGDRYRRLRALSRWGFAAAVLTLAAIWVVWRPDDIERLLAWGDRIADAPGIIVGLILLQALMLVFALPASAVVWLVAPFHEPLTAVAILLSGSLLGAAGAYWMAGRLGPGEWAREHRAFRLLRRNSDGLTQLALRMLPGFPHFVINYAAGALRLPLRTFFLAAFLGLGFKWGIYCTAIYGVVEAEYPGEAIRLNTVMPLIILAAFLLVGTWARGRLEERRLAAQNNRH